MANNNFPQITSVTSEALQAQIRNLLPSQEGFGTDLMAQNVIVPVVDLTSAAEGSQVLENLQTALAFGSQNEFVAQNSTAVIANTAGFWRITGTVAGTIAGASGLDGSIVFSDGLSNKNGYRLFVQSFVGDAAAVSESFDLTVFLKSGESVSAVANNRTSMSGSARQIADTNGNLINPSGFTPQ